MNYISHRTGRLLCLQAGSMCESVHKQLTLELATNSQRLSGARSMLDEADTEIKRSSIKIYIARLKAESSDLESRVRAMAEALAPGTQLASISFLTLMTVHSTCPLLSLTECLCGQWDFFPCVRTGGFSFLIELYLPACRALCTLLRIGPRGPLLSSSQPLCNRLPALSTATQQFCNKAA